MSINKELVWGVLFIVAAILLLRNPRCNRGCKTVAEHLLSHGVDDLATVLLA